MDQRKVDFRLLAWQTPLPKARYKASQHGNRRIRLAEFAKGFVEADWCKKAHTGYVLDGEMDVDFDGQVVRFSRGDGLVIPAGEENRHKATVITDVVRLFLVEDAEPAGRPVR
jgi:quercetin dioxygenase-like cupin family protein